MGSESAEGSKLSLQSVNWPMRDAQEIDNLIARSEATQFDFLRAELEIGHTLARLAITEREIEDAAGFDQARGNAEARYETISRFVSRLRDPAHQEEIKRGLRELRTVLDRLAWFRLKRPHGSETKQSNI